MRHLIKRTRQKPIKEHPRPFCCGHGAVLDCANGYQKENQEEVNNVEKRRRPEVAGEAASTEPEYSKEIGDEESHSEESCSQEKGADENAYREEREWN